MIVSTIQLVLISAAIGFVLGVIVGWRLTFNARLAKIQEQQVKIDKLKRENSELSSKLRSYKIGETKEWVEGKVSGAKEGASTLFDGIKNKIWKEKDNKDI